MLAISVIVLVINAFGVTLAEPQCHMVELGTCVSYIANYINSLPRREVPKTEDDIKQMCKAIADAVDCWDDYKKRCMTPIQKELEALYVEGGRALQDQFCSPGSALTQKYLKHAKCLGEVVGSEENSGNIERTVLMYEQFDEIPDTKKLEYGCCGWNVVYKTLRDHALRRCGEGSVEIVEELLSSGVSDLPNVICGGFDPVSEQCLKITPAIGMKTTGKRNPFVDGVRYFFKNHID